MIKEEVWMIVEDLRSFKHIFLVFNANFLMLIPKSEVVDSLGMFIPIPLYKVIYKIVTKVIANRLNHILPNLISPK